MKIQHLAFAMALGAVNLAHGAIIYDIAIDTSPLIGHPAGLFALNVQLNDGSGLGDANNTAMLSNIQFDGGSAFGSPSVTGGASGNLSSAVRITDSAFLNSFTQAFLPGSSLRFRLDLTTNPDAGPTPDQFSLALLDRSGFEVPTAGIGVVGSDVLLLIDIDSPNPAIQTFGADISRSPFAGGPPIDFAAPETTVIPEPGTYSLLGIGALALILARRSVHRAGAAS